MPIRTFKGGGGGGGGKHLYCIKGGAQWLALLNKNEDHGDSIEGITPESNHSVYFHYENRSIRIKSHVFPWNRLVMSIRQIATVSEAIRIQYQDRYGYVTEPYASLHNITTHHYSNNNNFLSGARIYPDDDVMIRNMSCYWLLLGGSGGFRLKVLAVQSVAVSLLIWPSLHFKFKFKKRYCHNCTCMS